MSLLAEIPQGIPFSADEIRSHLEAAAIAGFTGTIMVSIGLRAEAAKLVLVDVEYKHSHMEGKSEVTLPDPMRKKPVGKVVDGLTPKLFIRPMVTAIELNFLKGVLQPHWTHTE